MTDTSFWFAVLAALSWGIAPLFEKWGGMKVIGTILILIGIFLIR
ncbi:hypothetical protein [Effusibacillus pohliae]|nr:hypothetical protein [Effusibacillus pohliae]